MYNKNGIKVIGVTALRKMCRTAKHNNNSVQINYNSKTKRIWGDEVVGNSYVKYDDNNIILIDFLYPDRGGDCTSIINRIN